MTHEINMMAFYQRQLNNKRTQALPAQFGYYYEELEALYCKHCANNGGDLKVRNLGIKETLNQYRNRYGA